MALGYEDLNDHDDLRHDPLMAVLVGKADPMGNDRHREQDRGKALAGKSTLNRLERTPTGANAKSRYKKICVDRPKVQRLFTSLFLQAHDQPPTRIVLDLDATDDPLHGHQAGRFFHGYDKSYCYLPLYIFCGEHLLCARLRPADIDGAAGSVKALEQIVKQIREQWPDVQIVIRADSGFCRETIMAWCEENGIDYVRCAFLVRAGVLRTRRDGESNQKEQQLCLFADRTSAASMRANEQRLWFSSVAYVLVSALRRLGLSETKMAHARCDTIRLKLLKIGAQVCVTVRKVWVRLAESCPYQTIFQQVYEVLRQKRPQPFP